MSSLPPGFLLLLGAVVVPLLRGRVRSAYLLALPVLSFVHLLLIPQGEYLQFELFDYTLTPVRIDALALVWGYIFHLAAFLCVVFALHVKDTVQLVAGFLYVGAAIAAVFAGDLITLFVFWELTAISSVFLIWARRTERSYRAGMRYLIVQVGSGVLLLAGTLFHLNQTGAPSPCSTTGSRTPIPRPPSPGRSS
jgi:multicomponent Na+:H+ antiporter subunit D